MTWIKSNWRWAALNGFAVAAFIFVLSRGSTHWSATHTFDPGLESGKWAIRFLLVSLLMTPLATYLGWSAAIKLRKPAGLWAFGFAALHVAFYVSDAKLNWLSPDMPPFLALGLFGLIVLTALAVTSNRWAMRHLKRNWKQLQRLVYLAGISVTVHAILATTMSKKMFLRDPGAIHELKLYLAVLAVLLLVRVPAVRRALKTTMAMVQLRRLADLSATTVIGPQAVPRIWPAIHAHDADVSEGPIATPIQIEMNDVECAHSVPHSPVTSP